jgi:chitin-binding protein
MTAVPRIATAVVSGALLAVSGALPAAAHGWTDRPASRTDLCGPEGTATKSAACRAALKAGGAEPDWDYLRIADVDGRDREVVPDGKLCSAGIPEFRGLDLPREDWPTTTVRAGATYRFEFRVTIPHAGRFRFYVTKDGYDPAKRLTWADLESKPFASLTEPPARDGAYTMSAKLPADKSGRHLIYTVWETTDTPDTYYSCSDVVFTGAAKKAATAAKPRASKAAGAGTGAKPAASATGAAEPTADPSAIAAANASATAPDAAPGTGRGVLPFALVSLVALLVAAGIAVAARRTRRSSREE